MQGEEKKNFGGIYSLEIMEDERGSHYQKRKERLLRDL